MFQNIFSHRKFPLLVIGFITLVYVLFPNSNPTLDAWGYAGEVKHGVNLFRPHHLLYSALQFAIVSFYKWISVDVEVIRLMQAVNGLFAGLTVLVFYRLLINLRVEGKIALAWAFFAASSFAVMRYATENETYIIPIFFSLCGSYFFQRYLAVGKYMLLAGLFTAVACLIHQIHFFWWISILVVLLTQRKFKPIVHYVLPALLVPITYTLIVSLDTSLTLSPKSVLAFVFEYYQQNDDSLSIGLVNFVMTPISFVRTYLQVHGNLLDLFHLFTIRFVFAFAVVTYFLGMALKSIQWKRNQNIQKWDEVFVKAHILIFSLQLIFAFISDGNAEFMVMLPFLFPFVLNYFTSFNAQTITYVALGMFVWNFSFAVLPNHTLNYENNAPLVEYIHQHPNQNFLLQDKRKVDSRYYYQFGTSINDRIYDTADDFLSMPDTLITDVLNRRIPLNRARMVESSNTFNYRKIKEVQTIPAFYGSYTLDLIVLNRE